MCIRDRPKMMEPADIEELKSVKQRSTILESQNYNLKKEIEGMRKELEEYKKSPLKGFSNLFAFKSQPSDTMKEDIEHLNVLVNQLTETITEKDMELEGQKLVVNELFAQVRALETQLGYDEKGRKVIKEESKTGE
eukprot:TRINITY_DN11706_c0_g1_i3.p1 TRINITY_DN11706_c0_g1~~TRINITY_DN11706_c0_g1_i3.p1  ORF type:complete len:156 (+),score=33.64 TRINITY_DN11706_c0_g1_i3:63-470(+)